MFKLYKVYYFKNYKKIGTEKLIEKSNLKLNKKINGIYKFYKIWICKN